MDIIQVGDRVTIDCMGDTKTIIITREKEIEQIKDNVASYTNKILKIERPKYEVVEEKKELLDKKEREYLSNVIKPFKNIVENIEKREWDKKEYIHIKIKGEIVGISFPYFKSNTMYKGMEEGKKYTLSELGLEED